MTNALFMQTYESKLSIFLYQTSLLSALQCLVSGDHRLVKLDHERGALVPVDCDLGGEAAVGEDGLYDPSGKGCTVQRAVLFRNGDVRVDEGLLLDDVVGLIVVVGLLQLVCFLAKQGSPNGYLRSMKQTTEEYLGGGSHCDFTY